VGFFGSYLYADGHWREEELTSEAIAAEPWLHASVHDSDFTAVTYRPTGPGSGVAFLGYTPRSYFEMDDASAPTDVARESAGLTHWWALVHGATSTDEITAKNAELIGYLAADLDPASEEPDTDVDLNDDAEIFVEIKTSRFLAALGLPLPEDLPIG
jgi:hypothetical protein